MNLVFQSGSSVAGGPGNHLRRQVCDRGGAADAVVVDIAL
jgi:hypothetical protein